MKFINSEQKSFEVSNADVRGISVNTILIANAVNVQPTIVDFNDSIIGLKVELIRNGIKQVLRSVNMQVQARLSNFNRPTNQFTIAPQILVTATAGLAGQSLITYQIDFGGIINLRGTDKLIVTPNYSSNPFSSIVSNSSYSDINVIKQQGVEYGIPVTTFELINTNESTRDFSLGNNVKNISFVSLDKIYRNFPVQSIVISTEENTQQMNSFEIYRDTISEMSNYPSADFCALSDRAIYIFHREQMLQNTQISLTLDPTQINVNKNYLIYTNLLITAESLERAGQIEQLQSPVY